MKRDKIRRFTVKRTSYAIIFLLIFLTASIACADEVKIATGHTFIKRVFDPIKNTFRDKTGIDISILFFDPVPALAELEKDSVDAAGASLTLENWLELGKKAGIPVKEKSAYTSSVVVTEKSMFVVHAENRITSLSREQLKGIFTGKIVNWKEVGGDDAPILVVWPTLSSGALIIVKQKIMDNEELTKTLYDVESIGETPDAVASTPEAIGVVTGNIAGKGLREIAPAIERPLTLVYKGKPSANLRKLLDFLHDEGRLYIK